MLAYAFDPRRLVPFDDQEFRRLSELLKRFRDSGGYAEDYPQLELFPFEATARLLAREAASGKPLPDYRRMPWPELAAWTAEHADVVGWEERKVVHAFPDGWTVEKVSTINDICREGVVMHHCLDTAQAVLHGDIYSLRDPTGKPHATITVTNNTLGQVEGKGARPPKPHLTERVLEFAEGRGFRYTDLEAFARAFDPEMADEIEWE